MGRLDHLQIIKEYESLSQYQIAKRWRTTQPVISKILRQHGVSRASTRKYKIINIFTRWDEFSAYVFGFLLADGHIVKKDSGQRGRRYKIQVNLQGRDASHLQRIANQFCDTLKVKLTNRTRILSGGCPKEYYNARLNIYSTDVVDSLIKMGWDGFKNGDNWKPFLLVPANHFRHMLRGYFDGDGGFYLNERVPCIYVLGEYQFLQWLQARLSKILCTGGHIVSKKSISRLTYNGRFQVAEIAEYLYAGSEISLGRKMALSRAAMEQC